MSIVIYGRDNCNYCKLAKKYVEVKALDYTYHDIGELSDEEYESVIEKAPGVKTVPIIFVNDVWIGGFDELRKSV